MPDLSRCGVALDCAGEKEFAMNYDMPGCVFGGCGTRAEMRERHGTPGEFERATTRALGEISIDEWQAANRRYRLAYAAAPERHVPTNAEWAAGHTKSVADQVSRRPLSSRLIDVAALCFLRGLALADWVARRLP